jgi:hypothetical protein
LSKTGGVRDVLKHPLTIGTVLGGLGGGALGYLTSPKEELRARNALVGAGVGAGTGALAGGLAAPTPEALTETIYAPSREQMTAAYQKGWENAVEWVRKEMGG